MDRYRINKLLEHFGEEGQKRLKESSVLIIGCGALGSTASVYCAASGVGRIGLVDFDTVDISNLQRQVFFKEDEAGDRKAVKIAEAISGLNSDCIVTTFLQPFTKENSDRLVKEYDFIVDAADNPSTTYLIEEVCNRHDKGYVTAGVAEYHAQIMTHLPGTADFSDFFPYKVENKDKIEVVLPCSYGGVFGPLAGMVATLEASEVVKVLSGCGYPLTDALLRIDLRTNIFDVIRL